MIGILYRLLVGSFARCKHCGKIKEKYDYHILQETMHECAQGEFSDLTCVKMSIKFSEQAYNDASTDPDKEAYDTAMTQLHIDADKMRYPKTTAGKKLKYLMEMWWGGRQMREAVNQWIEHATPEKLKKLQQLLEEE